jgi:uncharacterized protein YwqG
MVLIAMLRLSELGTSEIDHMLPARGLLYFWYDVAWQPWGFDPEDRSGFRIDYWPDEDAELRVREFPGDPTRSRTWKTSSGYEAGNIPLPEGGAFRPCRVQGEQAMSLPSCWEALRESPTGTSVLREDDRYTALVDALPAHQVPDHRLFGYPNLIQGPMELECQLASNGLYCGDASGYQDPRRQLLEPGSKDWRLLLQIDSDEDGPGWMWGDCGRLFYWIRAGDLKARDFSHSWLVLQCF